VGISFRVRVGCALQIANSPRKHGTSCRQQGFWEAILSEPLDAVDAHILELLQRDASLSIADIAEKVGLSSSPAWRRIERLKKAGVILRQVTLLDHEKLGLTFEVFASVKLQLPSRENLEQFEAAVMDWPEVVECATVTGAVDYMLRVVTTDMHAYDDFLRDKMLALGLVSDVQSRIVMRAAKRTTAAPLELISSDLSD
jgi:DNA-binding Lrp family transcriptional regulator